VGSLAECSESRTGGRRAAIWLAILLPFLMFGCAPSTPTPHVVIAREVFLKQEQGCVRSLSITSTKDGGLILTGLSTPVGQSRGEACATRINAQGEIQWRYDEPHDDSFGEPYRTQSHFGGAVVLSDNSVVICGGKDTSEGELGLIVRISVHGEVLSKETLTPKGGASLHLSRFDRCVPWQDGAALLGWVPRAPRADGWLVKLDGTGRMVWEMVGQDYGAEDALELADHSLVMGHAGQEPLLLVRVSPDGVVQSERLLPCTATKVPCGYFNLFHHVTPSPDIRLVSFQWPQATIYHLDAALNDLEPPVQSRAMQTSRAFELGDGAVYFGGYSAASIAYVARTGELSGIYTWQPTWDQNHLQIVEESINVNDAAATSDTDFVSVRERAGPHIFGTYVDWISIQ
jgi:hypothetical protein